MKGRSQLRVEVLEARCLLDGVILDGTDLFGDPLGSPPKAVVAHRLRLDHDEQPPRLLPPAAADVPAVSVTVPAAAAPLTASGLVVSAGLDVVAAYVVVHGQSCSAPANLAITSGNHSLGLAWEDTAEASAFRVYRSTKTMGPYTHVATVATTAYDDLDLHNELAYFYRVQAVCGLGASDLSLQEFGVPRDTTAATGMPADWPHYTAPFALLVDKWYGAEGHDQRWFHMHVGSKDENYFGLQTSAWRFDYGGYTTLEPPAWHQDVQVQYTVRGIPLHDDWLNLPAQLSVDDTNPAFAALLTGFYDVSVRVRQAPGTGGNIYAYRPERSFVHLNKGEGPMNPIVPIIGELFNSSYNFSPGVAYVDTRDSAFYNPSTGRFDATFTGYPLNPAGEPWTTPPGVTDLYAEYLQPHSEFFSTQQLLWEDPPHPLSESTHYPFIRAWDPNRAQQWTLPSLWDANEHRKFPIKDGPRGQGWMSPYVGGSFDSTGVYAFAETQGAIRALKPDGEIITVAGWRVRPDRFPVWPTKPLNLVRSTQEFLGDWREGLDRPGWQGDLRGMHQPLDVAIDPRDDNVWYVASFDDHVIWKVEIADRVTWSATVTVYAGNPDHWAGYWDGQGHGAGFNGPSSLVWKVGPTPAEDVLYVADTLNDAIRAIDRDRNVTTFIGGPNQEGRIRGRFGGAPIWGTIGGQASNRQWSAVEGLAHGAAKLESFFPQVVRTDSQGRLLVMDLGFGSIRRLDSDVSAQVIVNTWQKWNNRFDIGWAWMDVDRWGNSGPRDGIYWIKSNSDGGCEGCYEGSFGHFNETYAWSPASGGGSQYFYGDRWDPRPQGLGLARDAMGQHYPWVIAVDPRGGVLTGGFGANGLSRVRGIRWGVDPLFAVTQGYDYPYLDARRTWAAGYAGGPYRPRPATHSRGQSLIHGWDGHNSLGFRDAWGLTGSESPHDVFQIFQVTRNVRDDPVFRGLVFDYLWQNKGFI